jgi:glycosyltransferase involved in cell wall biosynthesis
MRLFEYQDQCLELAANTPGVVFKGSVDWATMAEAQKDAEIWLYPTNFGEISCVAAMEAMAAGCKCVATSSAALAETLKDYPGWYELVKGTGTWGEELRRVALDWTCNPTCGEHARKFDINQLADQWEELFNGS